jgi:VIT1/CCC1 family predicted Fe2+/Mn2+ transporter
VAEELTRRDAFAAHLEVELGIDRKRLASPWRAAFASAVSFTTGALLPLIAVLAPPSAWRIPVTFVAVLAVPALTGDISARLGRASRRTAIARLVVGGGLALLVTYGIGRLVGAVVA